MRASAFAAVLEGVEFPVRRWEIAAAAEDWGVDALTRTKIQQIPDRVYTDVYDIVIAITNTPAHLARRAQL